MLMKYTFALDLKLRQDEYKRKHSIASMDVSMKSNTFALQNIKQRIWQAVKILKGYWSFTTRSQRQVEYQRSITGMYFQHKNLDYKSLKDLVGKLEVLCLR